MALSTQSYTSFKIFTGILMVELLEPKKITGHCLHMTLCEYSADQLHVPLGAQAALVAKREAKSHMYRILFMK